MSLTTLDLLHFHIISTIPLLIYTHTLLKCTLGLCEIYRSVWRELTKQGKRLNWHLIKEKIQMTTKCINTSLLIREIQIKNLPESKMTTSSVG